MCHHGILAHGLGVQAIRANAPAGTQVGLAENATVCVPVIETEEHIKAALKATRVLNAQFLTAIMEGKYIEEYLKHQGADAPKVQPDDFKAIGSKLWKNKEQRHQRRLQQLMFLQQSGEMMILMNGKKC